MFCGNFFVKLLDVKTENLFYIKHHLWVKTRTIFMKKLMIKITREQSKSFMMLVEQKSLLVMLLCLFMDLVCLSIHNSMVKIYKSINCYHIHIWEVLKVIMEKNYKRKWMLDLAGEAEFFAGGVLKQWQQINVENFW